MSDSAYPAMPSERRNPATFSQDGLWWWDGYRWVPAITPDGVWRFNGLVWDRVVRRAARPRWLTITGLAWLVALGAWLLAAVAVLDASTPEKPDRTAGITILAFGALGALATLAWGCLVGRRAATRWLWQAAAIGTGVQLYSYLAVMVATEPADGPSNDTAAAAGIVILAAPTGALILLLLWAGAAVGALSRKLKSRSSHLPRNADAPTHAQVRQPI